jgi:hypothetical protein
VDLVSDPRFARNVRNVVVEFGGAAAQPIVDRFVDGEAVSYPELRKVWTEVVGWVPSVLSLGYMRFYAAVRAANFGLPPEQRIRVWLGEPGIDWSTVQTREALKPLLDARDSHPADLIKNRILAKGEKAVVIYGTGHFLRGGFYNAQSGSYLPSLLDLIEKDDPGSLFLVVPYAGSTDAACADDFESLCADWPTPALVQPIKGTRFQDILMRPEFRDFDMNPREDKKIAETQARLIDTLKGATADALLYLGPSLGLTESPVDPSIYLDLDFFNEANRRAKLLVQQSTSFSEAIGMGTPIPQFIKPR